MLNSGKKFRALCDKTNKYSNSRVVGKKNYRTPNNLTKGKSKLISEFLGM